MKFSSRLLILVSLVIFVSSISVPVYAQPTPGQGLEISPPLIERSVVPGQSITLDVKLRNITTSTLITTGSIEDFVAQGEEGQPKLLLDSNAEPSPYTFKPWVKSITKLTLAPQESKVARVVIDVPQNASPGGHYGVIRFSAVPPELEGTGVALSASLGTLVLLNVAGDVVKKASIEEFYSSQNNQKKSFFEKGPITIGLRIKNEGSIHIKPEGTIRITNTFGRETAVLSVNELGGNILPSSIRKFEKQFEKSGLFGRYKAEANVQYDGQSLNQSITFWVIPYKTIAIILGILILAAVILRAGLKRYNRYIIKKAKASEKHKDQ